MNLKQLERLKKEGKIRNFQISGRPKIDRKIMLRVAGKQWYWIALILEEWAKVKNLQLLTEFQFHDTRKWRFDFAIPSEKIAIEYEGIFSTKSRHTTFKGYTGDTDKYNAAAADGWTVIRLTASNYKSLLDHLKNLKLNGKQAPE